MCRFLTLWRSKSPSSMRFRPAFAISKTVHSRRRGHKWGHTEPGHFVFGVEILHQHSRKYFLSHQFYSCLEKPNSSLWPRVSNWRPALRQLETLRFGLCHFGAFNSYGLTKWDINLLGNRPSKHFLSTRYCVLKKICCRKRRRSAQLVFFFEIQAFLLIYYLALIFNS